MTGRLVITEALLRERPVLRGNRYDDVLIRNPYEIKTVLEAAGSLEDKVSLTQYLYKDIPPCLTSYGCVNYFNQLNWCLTTIGVEMHDEVLDFKGNAGKDEQPTHTKITDTLLSSMRIHRYLKNDARRATGRTLTDAIGFIHEAMEANKGLGATVYVRDRHGTAEANRQMVDGVMQLVDKLELQGFTANKTDLTITYKNPLL